jgi:hypothetical protein
MDLDRIDDRIEVTAGATMLGVTLKLGDVQVTVSLPAPAGLSELSVDQVRTLAFRHARRALEVAREELG